MKVEFVNPFIQAAREVLESELGAEAARGNLRLQKSAYTTDEVTALVGDGDG
jgi:CheY-specific phosphatase CheX